MSRLYVDRISPYQSGSLTIDGFQAAIDTGSFATTGSNTFIGNQVISGSLTVGNNGLFTNIVDAPNPSSQKDLFGLTSAEVGGTPFSYVRAGWQNYGGYAEDVFGIDFDANGNFNQYGGYFAIGGKGWNYNLTPSGSSLSSIRLRDTGASSQASIFSNGVDITSTTGNIKLNAASQIELTGSVNIKNVTNVGDDIKQSTGVSGNAAYIQNPNYFSEYYGSTLLWSPTNYGGQTNLWLNEKSKAEIQINAWSSSYDNVMIPYADGNGTYIADWNGSYTITPWITIPKQQTPAFNRGLDITGSLSITETAKLAPQDPLPSGELGMLAVSGSDLYFHNGTSWVVK